MSVREVNQEVEYVEDAHWVARHPSAALSMCILALAGLQMAGQWWLEEQQRPHRYRASQESRQLATFGLEAFRHFDSVLARIADSANVKMPRRPKELDRAEGHVRDIQERVN